MTERLKSPVSVEEAERLIIAKKYMTIFKDINTLYYCKAEQFYLLSLEDKILDTFVDWYTKNCDEEGVSILGDLKNWDDKFTDFFR